MKRLLIVAALCTIITGCQKEISVEPQTASSASIKQQPLVISEIWEGSRLIQKFSYHDKRLAMIEYWGGSQDIFTYDDANHSIRMDQPKSNPRTWFIYQFNENNVMQYWTRWSYNKPVLKRTYYYDRGKLARVTTRGFPDAPYPYSNDFVFNWTSPWDLVYTVVFVDQNEVPWYYDTSFVSWHTPFQRTAYWVETPDELYRITYSTKIKSPTYNLNALPFLEEIRSQIPRKELLYQKNVPSENASPQMLQLYAEITDNRHGPFRYDWKLDGIISNREALPTQYDKIYMNQYGQEASRVRYRFVYVQQ